MPPTRFQRPCAASHRWTASPANANGVVPSVTSETTTRDTSPTLAVVQCSSCSDCRPTFTPSSVPIHTESPRVTIPLILSLVNGEGFTPSGSTPETWVPSHTPNPRVVPIHRLSPWGVRHSTESAGRPSNALTSAHVVRSDDSTLTPLPAVPIHIRRERSNVIEVSRFIASPLGSREIVV